MKVSFENTLVGLQMTLKIAFKVISNVTMWWPPITVTTFIEVILLISRYPTSYSGIYISLGPSVHYYCVIPSSRLLIVCNILYSYRGGLGASRPTF